MSRLCKREKKWVVYLGKLPKNIKCWTGFFSNIAISYFLPKYTYIFIYIYISSFITLNLSIQTFDMKYNSTAVIRVEDPVVPIYIEIIRLFSMYENRCCTVCQGIIYIYVHTVSLLTKHNNRDVYCHLYKPMP